MSRTLNVRHRQWQAHVRRQKRHGYKITKGALRDGDRWARRGDWKERVRTRFNNIGRGVWGDENMWFDRAGNPIGMGDEMILRTDPTYNRIARTRVGRYVISTVWLGMDHGHYHGGPEPVIFETMIFGPGGDMEEGLAGEMWRYSTEEEAREGHARVCALVQLEMAAQA